MARIIVVDGGHARFVRPDADNTLRTVGSFDSASAHLSSHDIGFTGPAARSPAVDTRHAVGARHNLHAMDKERFIGLVG
jgi:hypothetical protein